MRAVDRDIREFLTANNNYIIPVYQRNYDWGKNNCKKLIQDIIISEQEKRQEYFLGSFVTVQKSPTSLTDFYIIDGQQRLTSLTLLLLAIYNVSDETLKNTMIPFIFTNSSGDKRLILKQIQKDEMNLSKILKDEELHQDNSNIINNYLFFRDYILEHPKDIALIIGGLNRLRFVHIQLQPHDHPQLVFETLNATGKELSEADKIRNFILMYEEQEHLYENYWVKIEENCQQNLNPNNVSGLMKAFLTIEYRSNVSKPIKDDMVYQVFKEYYDNSNKNNKEILSLIKDYSLCYYKILKPENHTSPYSQSLKNIKDLELTALNPLILAILKLEENSLISSDTATYLISLLEKYLVRRGLCDVPSNALNKVAFALIHKLFLTCGSEQILAMFEQTLLGLKGSARFPKDEEVLSALEKKPIYKTRLLGRFILIALETYNSKEKNDMTDISIEHIMPQKLNSTWINALGKEYSSIHEEYLHTLGNLTFTGYNSELGNKALAEKLPILQESKFHFLNNEFRNSNPPQSWSKTEILERTKRLAQCIIQIYPIPNVDIIYDSLDLLEDNEDLSYREIVYFEYNSQRYDARENTWAYFMVDFLKILYTEDPVRFQQMIIENLDFKNKLSWEFHQSWTPITIDNRIFYVNTVTDTNSKIATLRKIVELLNLIDNPITLYLKSE